MIVSATADPYANPGKKKLHDTRKSHSHGNRAPAKGTFEWLGVDGEGVTDPVTGEHKYVLLGVDDEQIDNPDGLHWREIFEFLYEHYAPKRALVGFYLGYDFTQWLKTLPEDRAWRLLTIDGKESRRSRSPKLRGKFLPVDLDGWQVDMIGQKRLSIRPRVCECVTYSCEHKKAQWLHICDAGPFFQTSFLNVIKPSNWLTPIVSDDEYATIVEGKERRATAVLDQDMRRYNVLENVVLARVMHDLDDGFRRLDVTLSPGQWYGPGQAAAQWLKGRAPSRESLQDVVPSEFYEAARASYFGGWFEIMAHGVVEGVSHEYDINSAYPHIISQLPCLLHGKWSSGMASPPRDGYTLVKTTAWTAPPHSLCDSPIGAMLHRNLQARICRPLVTTGWFWKHELDAAVRAKVVSAYWRRNVTEWVHYSPCECQPPVWQARNLYQMRLDVGKKSSLGKSAKLVNNSGYGKFAQSVGAPFFANPVYASLITAGCRTMILDAIASHPKGKDNVLMVATDGVYFLDPHPDLAISESLGDWDHECRENLTLFKPGVYWDDGSRAAIRDGRAAAFKARGVNAREFSATIGNIDAQFASWLTDGPSWPSVGFSSSFNMVTALQAQTRGKWDLAGVVENDRVFMQSANPDEKRRADSLTRTTHMGRTVWRTLPLPYGANAMVRLHDNPREWGTLREDFSSVPYTKRFGMDDPFSDEVRSGLGVNGDEEAPMIGAFRLLTGQER